MIINSNTEKSFVEPNHDCNVSDKGNNHVVLIVEDHRDARPELKQALELSGYNIIGSDNGQDAARRARQIQPDLLLVDMDVPLIYGLVAARQIIKQAQVGPMPVVIVTNEDVVDPAPLMELDASRNEYVTRISDYEELQHLLDYLLPALPPTADATPTHQPGRNSASVPSRVAFQSGSSR